LLTFLRLLAVLPLSALHLLGAVLGWIAFLASSTYRRRFLANSAQAGLRFTQVSAAVAAAGALVAELPRLWFGRSVRIEWCCVRVSSRTRSLAVLSRMPWAMCTGRWWWRCSFLW
jgi:lauroyl/myristoyl acyltransferase